MFSPNESKNKMRITYTPMRPGVVSTFRKGSCILLSIVLLIILYAFLNIRYEISVQPKIEFNNLGNSNKLEVEPLEIDEDAVFNRLLKMTIECKNKDFKPVMQHMGEFWILKNYIRAEHGDVDCFSTVTYTTHGDLTFLDNVVPLLNRWKAPLSLALYAPGDDFEKTLDSIFYYRNCHPERSIVRQYATFHIYFQSEHFPNIMFNPAKVLDRPFLCPAEPFKHETAPKQLYKAINNLTYPINVGRNLARDSALTKYVLASDIELYPNPGLIDNFLAMLTRNPQLAHEMRNAYVLPIFEVEKDSEVPLDKSELFAMFGQHKAIWFHYNICPTCHSVPEGDAWLKANESEMHIFATTKRVNKFNHWEPIFIGTNEEPFYDERLSWEGKSDKMTQGYVLCLLDYNFNVLSDGFLVHRPGIKTTHEAARPVLESAQRNFIQEKIMPEISKLYEPRSGCVIH